MKLILLAIILASPASASTISSGGTKVRRWDISRDSPTLTYFIDSSAAANASMIQNTFSAWESVPTAYVAFTAAASADDANIIIYRRRPSSGSAGQANLSTRGGYIFRCEVEISDAAATSYPVYLHEVGHCLGLPHSVVSGAIMSYRSDRASNLTDDDTYAITQLYPNSDGSVPVGCGTVARGGGNSPPPRGPGPLAAWFALWALAYGWMRFRPRQASC